MKEQLIKVQIYTIQSVDEALNLIDNLDLLDINEYNVDEVIDMELEAA